MAFAAGMHVFPGGAVDPPDAEVPVAGGPDATARVADAFGVDRSTATALINAAVRETFEECGVLLVDPAPAVDLNDPCWESRRLARSLRN